MYPNNSNGSQSNMDYLRSISATPQPETPANNPAPYKAPSSNTKKIIIFTVCMIAFVTLLGLAAVLANGDRKSVPVNKVVTPEEHRKEDELNGTLDKLAQKDPNYDYDSPSFRTYYFGYFPDEIIYEFKINVRNTDFSSAKSVPAMNSHIANYYLDQKDTIIVIVDPKGITGREKKTEILYVYASSPKDYDFLGFMPADFGDDGKYILKDETSLPEEGVVYFTRSELFNQLSADAKFYVIKKK